MIYKEPPPRKYQWSIKQVYNHAHKPGDEIAYISTNTRNKKISYQFTHCRIVNCVFDDLRTPRYEIKIIKRLRVDSGRVIKTGLSNRTNPLAYFLDRNNFPLEEWDDQIQRKVNRTNAVKYKFKN